tara:strand:- start:1963 stop:2712 length:750 start_codon:yes stop_codon:yes gene_type:complete
MVKFLYKKSYQLNSFKLIKYDDLWGKKGVFSTIRILGSKPKLILLNDHIKNMNLGLTKMNIKFVITKKIILELLKPVLSNIYNQDNLLRIAINSSTISLSLRQRIKPDKIFFGILYAYQRPIPDLKNLYYRKIIKLFSSINLQKQEIILHHKGCLLEGCTTNIICVRNKKIYIPKSNYYRGVTMNYLLKNSQREVKKLNISLNTLHKYEEIILTGSGKGVLNLSAMPQIDWKSQSDIVYKEFLNLYKKI